MHDGNLIKLKLLNHQLCNTVLRPKLLQYPSNFHQYW